MKITVEQNGKVTILRPQGNMTIGDGDVALREALQAELGKGNKRLVLNMSSVKYVDSAGLGELVASLKRTRDAQGNLKLCTMNDAVNNLMVLTKLIQIFEIFDTEVQAVSSYVD